MNTTTTPLRAALIRHSTVADLVQVERYMPANYEARMLGDDTIVITGHDNAGWTLDGYVIPRLESGWRFAKEILVDGSFIALDDDAEVGPCEHCRMLVYYGSGRKYESAWHFACWLAVK